jgi:four helix bundle protein
MSHSYKDLIVWQKAKALVVEVYRVTDAFPQSERYGLQSQLRRAAVSIASNIAEGQGRLTNGEFVQFLGNARGSLLEVETQFAIALDLDVVSKSKFDRIEKLTAEVLRLLNALITSLRSKAKGVSSGG